MWFLSNRISSLDWVWRVYVGLTFMTLGIPGLIRPEEVKARRARNRATVPAGKRRGDGLDTWLDRLPPNVVRLIGALSVLVGVAFILVGVGAAI